MSHQHEHIQATTAGHASLPYAALTITALRHPRMAAGPAARAVRADGPVTGGMAHVLRGATT